MSWQKDFPFNKGGSFCYKPRILHQIEADYFVEMLQKLMGLNKSC